MSPRVAPILAASTLSLALLACSAAATPPVARDAPTLASPPPTLATSARPAASPAPASTASADAGNVAEGPAGPELSIEPVDAATVRATIADPVAKAWRIVVQGTGSHATDRWALTVETSDIGPDITTTDTVEGLAGKPVVHEGLGGPGAAGRICARALPVCVRASSVVLPDGGNGTLVVALTRTDPSEPLTVVGATATWPTDPFVLGPWSTTEAFPWAS